jgi:predicted Zn-ribbon and HTH transcriptional regulator
MSESCKNCGYEVDEVHEETGFCQTCKNAYDLGYEKGRE